MVEKYRKRKGFRAELARNLRKLKKRGRSEDKGLFKGSSDLFYEQIESVDYYGEYGVGRSTLWVDKETQAHITGVDTSGEWIAHVSSQMSRPGHALRHIDVGPLGKWGKPRSFTHHANFEAYVEALWQGETKPQLVLVDGRFRVASFLTDDAARQSRNTRHLRRLSPSPLLPCH